MSKVRIPVCLLVMWGTSVWGQETWIDGEKYDDYVIIQFRVEVVTLKKNVSIYLLADIKPQFENLKKYLRRFEPIKLEQIFEGTMWGDTLIVNDFGDTVSVPEMSQFFQLNFPSPVHEQQTLKALKQFPEVEAVAGPVHIAPN